MISHKTNVTLRDAVHQSVFWPVWSAVNGVIHKDVWVDMKETIFQPMWLGASHVVSRAVNEAVAKGTSR